MTPAAAAGAVDDEGVEAAAARACATGVDDGAVAGMPACAAAKRDTVPPIVVAAVVSVASSLVAADVVVWGSVAITAREIAGEAKVARVCSVVTRKLGRARVRESEGRK